MLSHLRYTLTPSVFGLRLQLDLDSTSSHTQNPTLRFTKSQSCTAYEACVGALSIKNSAKQLIAQIQLSFDVLCSEFQLRFSAQTKHLILLHELNLKRNIFPLHLCRMKTLSRSPYLFREMSALVV